jgi:hypothetical protein
MNIWDYLNARAARNKDIDHLIATTQRNISLITLTIIGGVTYALFLGPQLDSVAEKLLFTVLGGLLTAWAMQSGFWYGRPRNAGVPDPANTTTRTSSDSVTTPSGTPTPPVEPKT